MFWYRSDESEREQKVCCVEKLVKKKIQTCIQIKLMVGHPKQAPTFDFTQIVIANAHSIWPNITADRFQWNILNFAATAAASSYHHIKLANNMEWKLLLFSSKKKKEMDVFLSSKKFDVIRCVVHTVGTDAYTHSTIKPTVFTLINCKQMNSKASAETPQRCRRHDIERQHQKMNGHRVSTAQKKPWKRRKMKTKAMH